MRSSPQLTTPRPALWTAIVLIVLGMSLAGLRVLNARQSQAQRAEFVARGIERTVWVLATVNQPSAGTPPVDAASFLVLEHNALRLIGPGLAELARGVGGRDARELKRLFDSSAREIALIGHTQSARLKARAERAIAPDGLLATRAAASIAARESERAALIDTQTTVGDGLLVLFMGAFVLIALRMARSTHQQQLDCHAEELRAIASRDPLTGVANRRRFDEDLCSYADRDRWHAIVIDLDEFKVLNDSAGHAAGDRLLIDVARALEGAADEGDVTYRLGGDEFCILTASETPSAVARRLRTAIDQAGAVASVGWASYPDDGADPSDVVGVADMRMYAAKPPRLTTTSAPRSVNQLATVIIGDLQSPD